MSAPKTAPGMARLKHCRKVGKAKSCQNGCLDGMDEDLHTGHTAAVPKRRELCLGCGLTGFAFILNCAIPVLVHRIEAYQALFEIRSKAREQQVFLGQ